MDGWMDERMDEWMKGWKAIRSGEIYKPFFFRDPLLTPRSLRSSWSFLRHWSLITCSLLFSVVEGRVLLYDPFLNVILQWHFSSTIFFALHVEVVVKADICLFGTCSSRAVFILSFFLHSVTVDSKYVYSAPCRGGIKFLYFSRPTLNSVQLLRDNSWT